MTRAAVLFALLAGVGCAKTAGTGPDAIPDQQIPVKVVTPRTDADLSLSVSQPCYVQAYYQAELMSRAAGPIQYLTKAIGDPIRKGELLVEVYSPDRVADLALKESLIGQAESALRLAEENVVAAQATVRTADNNVKVEKSTLISAESNEKFRASELKRFKVLAEKGAITADVVDEQNNTYQAALAALASARAGVARSESLQTESVAKLEAAKADVMLKASAVAVAKRERDASKANLELARLYAPFDGTVNHRYADPGTFVKDASGSAGSPILAVMRTDIVTIHAKLPDNFAPLLGPDTLGVIVMDELPGRPIKAKVTRFSQLIDGKDRTLRLELDVFNGPRADYDALIARGVGTELTAAVPSGPLEAVTAFAAAKATWAKDMKGRLTEFPQFPGTLTDPEDARSVRLQPGMYGTIRLVFRQMKGAKLLPASVVFSQGGKLLVAVVENGAARLVPVRVQATDGAVTKFVLIEKEADALKGTPEEIRDPKDGEVFVLTNQAELSNGSRVKATPTKW
jgi:multidrug resistance efflux pump